jgi:hypothetical protein
MTVARQIESWSRSKRPTTMVSLTPDRVAERKCSWQPTADRPEDKVSQAANDSKSMGHKIRRGRAGRFRDGYNPGGGWLRLYR